MEDRHRLGPACNERRHSPQRRLLVGKPLHLCARFRVGDRSRHQPRELAETGLRAWR